MENTTKFLDILFNEDFTSFNSLITKVLQELNLEEYGSTYHKKNNNYIIEVEKEDQLISILFNDYFMVIREGRFRKTKDLSEFWNKLIKQSILFRSDDIEDTMFKGILNKKQRAEFNRNLRDYKILVSERSAEQEEDLLQKELNVK